jgi:hypothetical protein
MFSFRITSLRGYGTRREVLFYSSIGGGLLIGAEEYHLTRKTLTCSSSEPR